MALKYGVYTLRYRAPSDSSVDIYVRADASLRRRVAKLAF